ncbi:MAG: hypothetical protein ABGX16_09220 [Pirellulales bacterium]
MLRSLLIMRSSACLALGYLVSMAAAQTANAQGPQAGYRAPNVAPYAQYGMSRPPASPLAGGSPAAHGDAYMDVHGNNIVMPASYCNGCQSGGYGGGGSTCPGAGYCQDNMAVNFGSCGLPDQCGPHYFDISAGVVYLRGEDLFEGVPAFTSVGVGLNAPRYLELDGEEEYEPGWKIAARIDLGPLSVFEATYMGLYDLGFNDSVRSIDVTNPSANFQLFSMFSNYGIGTLIPGVDDAAVVRLGYESDLQSTEFSYRRYWVGNNPRVSGTYLLGFRYLRLTDDLAYQTEAVAGNANRLWGGENDLLGAQIGGDGWVTLRQGLRLGGEIKAGLYNNHYVFTNSGDLPGTNSDFSNTSTGDQVAFAAEGSVSVVMDILPSVSLRGDYQVLYLNSLATAGGNVDPTDYFSTNVATQSDALYHGFSGGLEFIW